MQFKGVKLWGCLVALLVVGACGKATVPTDGSPEVPFGMSPQLLAQNGFTCQDTTECRKVTDRYVGSLDAPAASKPTAITVELNEGVASVISETYLDQDDDTSIANLTETYGKPKVCNYRNVLMAEIEFHVWRSPSGSTISVSKIADYGSAFDVSGMTSGSSTIEYRDAKRAQPFWRERCADWN